MVAELLWWAGVGLAASVAAYCLLLVGYELEARR